MKYAAIQQLSPEARQKELAEAQEKLHQLKFENAISPIENPMRIRQTKKRIAQLKTCEKLHKVQ